MEQKVVLFLGNYWAMFLQSQREEQKPAKPEVVGQFGTGQIGTRTIWHQHNKNGKFGTGQFGSRTIWHQHNKTDNLTPRKK